MRIIKYVQGTSQGVQRGVQNCALRAIHALAEQKDLHQALGVAGVPELLEVRTLATSA